MRQAFLFALIAFSLAASAITVSFQQKQLSLCQCESLKVPLAVTDYFSTPKISVSSPQNIEAVILTRNGEPPVGASLLLGASCSAPPGNYLVGVEATDSRSSSLAEGIVSVVECNSLSLQLTRIEKTCSFQEYYLEASNNGVEKQDVFLETNLAPSAFLASQTQFFLRPGEKQLFFIRVFPSTIAERTVFTLSLKASDASASLDLPFSSPLCEQGGAAVTSQPEQLSPLQTRAASFSLPSLASVTGLFLAGNFLAGKRFSTTAASLIVLALLAVGFLYFRYRYDEEKAGENALKELRQRAKRP